jgi:hypothetical protein
MEMKMEQFDEQEQSLRDRFDQLLVVRRRYAESSGKTEELKALGTGLFDEIKAGLTTNRKRQTKTKAAKE